MEVGNECLARFILRISSLCGEDQSIEVYILDSFGDPRQLYSGLLCNFSELSIDKVPITLQFNLSPNSLRNFQSILFPGCLYYVSVVTCSHTNNAKKQYLEKSIELFWLTGKQLAFNNISFIEIISTFLDLSAPSTTVFGENAMHLKWNPVQLCGISPEKFKENLIYSLEVSEGGICRSGLFSKYSPDGECSPFKLMCCGPSLLEAVVEDLKPCTWYYWRVTVQFKSDTISSEITSMATPPAPPSPPTELRALLVNKNRSVRSIREDTSDVQIQFAWSPALVRGSKIQKYQVQLQEVIILPTEDLNPGHCDGNTLSTLTSQGTNSYRRASLTKSSSSRGFPGRISPAKNVRYAPWRSVYCNLENQTVLDAPPSDRVEWRLHVRAKSAEGWGQFSDVLILNTRTHPSLFPSGFRTTRGKGLTKDQEDKEPNRSGSSANPALPAVGNGLKPLELRDERRGYSERDLLSVTDSYLLDEMMAMSIEDEEGEGEGEANKWVNFDDPSFGSRGGGRGASPVTAGVGKARAQGDRAAIVGVRIPAGASRCSVSAGGVRGGGHNDGRKASGGPPSLSPITARSGQTSRYPPSLHRNRSSSGIHRGQVGDPKSFATDVHSTSGYNRGHGDSLSRMMSNERQHSIGVITARSYRQSSSNIAGRPSTSSALNDGLRVRDGGGGGSNGWMANDPPRPSTTSSVYTHSGVGIGSNVPLLRHSASLPRVSSRARDSELEGNRLSKPIPDTISNSNRDISGSRVGQQIVGREKGEEEGRETDFLSHYTGPSLPDVGHPSGIERRVQSGVESLPHGRGIRSPSDPDQQILPCDTLEGSAEFILRKMSSLSTIETEIKRQVLRGRSFCLSVIILVLCNPTILNFCLC